MSLGWICRRIPNEIIVHTAGGLDFRVPVLKNLASKEKWKHPKKAKTAMVGIKQHMNELECYACHSTWVAQCYGCHVKVDYSNKFTSTDWVRSDNLHFPNGETAETMPGREPEKQPGKAVEGRSYLRWEDPIFGINGEEPKTK